MDNSIDSIIVRARRIIEVPGWNKTRLARIAGLGINGLVHLSSDDFNPTADKLRKLEEAVKKAESEIGPENGGSKDVQT